MVISHFKVHGFGGFGGALKQLNIGFDSRISKTIMHSAGTISDTCKIFQHFCSDKDFKECMADYASSFVNKYKGKLFYINVMKKISVDCDGNARPPCMKDIGIWVLLILLLLIKLA